MPVRLVHLVRHAHAGRRSAWTGTDEDRPLSDKGLAQAAWLAESLAGAPLVAVASSPFRRCVQTVEPLAEQAGLAVQRTGLLAEGADPAEVVRWLVEHAEGGLVACSHGDVIPKVLRLLLAEGLRSDSTAISQKGSRWVLEVDRGRFTTGTYHPPGPRS